MRAGPVKPVAVEKLIPKSGLRLLFRPCMIPQPRLAIAHSPGSDRKARAIPAGRLARNFRRPGFPECNAHARSRIQDPQPIARALLEDRPAPSPSFSKLPDARAPKRSRTP